MNHKERMSILWLKLFNGKLVDLSKEGQGSGLVWKNFQPVHVEDSAQSLEFVWILLGLSD